jgi:hypothetical protein
MASHHHLAVEHLALPEDGEAAPLEVDLTIDLDKLASDIVGAIWDDYENEKIVTRSRWEEIVKKAVKPHLLPQVPGGYGVGAFTVTMLEAAERAANPPFMIDEGGTIRVVEWPLLPDED